MPASRKPLQAPGSLRRRMVCPVGAVSKMMWSYFPMSVSSVSNAVNSSKAAISVVQAPESCSSIPARAFSGRLPRIGSRMRARYSAAAASGSISSALRPETESMAVTWLPIATPNTCPTFEAGSVPTSRTRLPASASCTAAAQASEVFPTPPLLARFA